MPKPRSTKIRKETIAATAYRYTAIFDPDPNGGYTVTVPSLPGLVTEGESFEEARAMVHEAILGYLEALRKHGEEIPIEDHPIITTQVAVTVPR